MGNPIDWGNSPLAVGLIRGIIAAFLLGLLQALIVHGSSPVSWETAITAGAVTGIPVLLALIGYGVADQNRANNNIVIAGDVPEAAEGVSVKKASK